MFDSALEELLFETVTLEPFTGYTGASQVQGYGAAVTYKAQVLPFAKKMVDSQGKEFDSNGRVVIPERVAVDPRSRLTLPAAFTPNQPPIRLVRPVLGLDLDHTELVF